MKIPEMIVIGKPVKSIGKKEEEIYKLVPSIIGTDFLEKYKFALYFNPSEKKAYFEIED